MSTNILSSKDIKRGRHTIDASSKILGRLSAQVARILMGKHKPNFVPYLDMGDYVVITNAKDIKFSGKKLSQKKYSRFSGYPGGLKFDSLSDLMRTRPEKVIEHSIKGMLPKGKLGRVMFKKLKVYKEEEISGR